MEHKNGQDGAGIEHLKKEALAIYSQLPMPKEKEEAWRHTNVEKFPLEKFLSFSSPHITLSGLSEEAKKKGVIFCTMKEALKGHYVLLSAHYLKNIELTSKFSALNAAFWQDGVFLHVPRNVHVEGVLSATLSSDKNTSIHNLIILEQGAQASYLEEYNYTGDAEMLSSCITEVFAKDASNLKFYHLAKVQEKANIFTHIVADVRKDAFISWAWATFGGDINRLRIDTLFNGACANAKNLGIMIGRRKQHLDCTTNAYHNAPNTTNDITANGIMMDNSSSIYRGLIKIEKVAQGTSSFLSNHILKLSEKAVANSIPALEIDANEVKASHGATVGQIDEEQLFYLRSRGLSLQEAEKLIVNGFFEPIIHKIEDRGIQEKFRTAVGEVV